MIGIFFTGFYFIDKIYKIADPCKKQEIITTNNPKTFDAENALIFGNASFAEDIAAKMASRNISCTIINDITRLDRSLSYKYLVAAGEDDGQSDALFHRNENNGYQENYCNMQMFIQQKDL
jgi:hypothetical protein